MIVCDRCGKVIDKKYRSLMNATEEEPCIVVNASIRTGVLQPWNDVELCQKCRDDFVKWIRKGGIEK